MLFQSDDTLLQNVNSSYIEIGNLHAAEAPVFEPELIDAMQFQCVSFEWPL